MSAPGTPKGAALVADPKMTRAGNRVAAFSAVNMGIFAKLDAGAILQMARRASHLAFDDAKRAGICKNPMDAAMLIYTDCPCTSAWLSRFPDLPEICGVSQIEGVACGMGDLFPPSSFEAERPDPDMPRVAAMFFFAEGTKCPRCRKVVSDCDVNGLCPRCRRVTLAHLHLIGEK